VEISPNDFRTISQLRFAGGSTADGLGTGINDNRQLTFYAYFTNGTSGIFTSDAVATSAVPEPASLLLGNIGLAFLLWARRRRADGRPGRVALLVGMLITSAVCSVATECAAADPIDTIALSGIQAPDVPTGISFAGFPSNIQNFTPPVPPTINSQGTVVFFGQLSGTGTTSANNIGVWSGTLGNVNVTALANDSALGIGAGVNYAGFLPPFSSSTAIPSPVPVNSSGQVAYDAFVTGININSLDDEGIWSGSRFGPTVAVREGDASAPNPPGRTFSPSGGVGPTFNSPYINDQGQIAFTGLLGSATSGIWSGAAGALQLVAESGQSAPGMAAGVVYASPLGAYGSYLMGVTGFNASNQVAFTAGLAGAGVTGPYASGIWVGAPGSVGLVARVGGTAPGLDGGAIFQNPFPGYTFTAPEINALGNVAFSAGAFEATGVQTSGIWTGDATGLTLVAADGWQAPGMANGVAFGTFAFMSIPGRNIQAPLLNAAGTLAFSAAVQGPGITSANNSGLWVGHPDGLKLIAAMGMQAPGAQPGVSFAAFSPISQFPDPTYPTMALNSHDQLAFFSQLSNGGAGIWGTDLGGHLREVVQTGDVLQIAPGDTRTVASIDFLGGSDNSDGRPSGFSDNGQVTFWAEFSDGSTGIFVSEALTVPEPGTWTLACLGLATLVGGAWRRSTHRK
jgi:hypothetical protein